MYSLIIFIFINKINSFILELLIKYFIKSPCAFTRTKHAHDELKNLCFIEIDEKILNAVITYSGDFYFFMGMVGVVRYLFGMDFLLLFGLEERLF